MNNVPIIEAYVGEYASGKSENAVNRALALNEAGLPVTIVDLDTVEPCYTLRPIKVALEAKGIYISAGSACSTHKRSQSPTLLAIGASKEQIESTVRFSFSNDTTMEEIDYTLEVLTEVLPMLRRYTRQ